MYSFSRKQMLYNQKVKPSDSLVRFMLTYSNQHQDIYHILKKYWFLLISDKVLFNYVFPTLSVTYRRSRSLRDALVLSHFEQSIPTVNTGHGPYPCGNCPFCEHLDIRQTLGWATQNVSCNSQCIVYLLLCLCGSFYVGKTHREFRRRMYKHIYWPP